MLKASAPTPLQKPFAANAGIGYIRSVPVVSQIAITPGAASFDDGFPPLNFLDPALSGGVPFSGLDVNGIFNAITNALLWEQMQGSATFNSATSVAQGGYPQGAILRKVTNAGYWVSLVDNNITAPDAGGAGWQHFNPIDSIATVALTNVNVTLSVAQYANPIIALTGALTANVQVILPAIVGQWVVLNSTTGAFTVTVKTPAGTGSVIQPGSAYRVLGDGTNILANGMTQAQVDARYAALAGNVAQLFSAAPAVATGQVVNYDQAFGLAQTAQNLITLRALGVTYTNTANKAIFVVVGCSSGVAGSGSISVSLGGVTFVIGAGNNTAGSYVIIGSFVVPAGMTYIVTSTAALTSWEEIK